MNTRHCAHCGDPFRLRPQSPRQTFCSATACQRARKLQWQRDKLQSDPDYRTNQRSAQRAWAARNGGYWRDWRQARHTSTPRSCAQPARTDAPRRAPEPVAPGLAKMDVSALPSGLYWISPRTEFPGAHGGSWIVEITPLAVALPRKMDV